jgi:hypothetical protein
VKGGGELCVKCVYATLVNINSEPSVTIIQLKIRHCPILYTSLSFSVDGSRKVCGYLPFSGEIVS